MEKLAKYFSYCQIVNQIEMSCVAVAGTDITVRYYCYLGGGN